MSADKNDTFFVGYLNTPATLKKFYWPLVVLLIGGCAFLGYWLGAQQKSEVPAIWNVGTDTEMQGFLTLTPYPVLHRIHPEDSSKIESVLLVNQGKYSAEKAAAGLDQKAVSVTGSLISRGGWTMLEVSSPDNFSVQSNPDLTEIQKSLETRSLGAITLNGEIADSKCFLGVMKPGAGKIHKACAEVCLLGGIPSMLVAKDDDGNKYGYVLTLADGSAASTTIAGYTGESVQVTGELQQQGDLLFIKMNNDGLKLL